MCNRSNIFERFLTVLFFFFLLQQFFVISLCITYVFTSLNPTVYILPVSVLFLFLFVFLGSGPLHLVYFVLFASLVSSQVFSFVFLRLCYTYVFFFFLKTFIHLSPNYSYVLVLSDRNNIQK